ncbi:MAG: 30S ribosomal protein S21 [Patescibacteria group bacterium]
MADDREEIVRNQQSSRPSFERREPRKEGFEALLRRFFRDVQQSGILSEAKKRRYRSGEISRVKRRQIATRKAARRRVKRGY